MLITFGWIVNNVKGLSISMFHKTDMENLTYRFLKPDILILKITILTSDKNSGDPYKACLIENETLPLKQSFRGA